MLQQAVDSMEQAKELGQQEEEKEEEEERKRKENLILLIISVVLMVSEFPLFTLDFQFTNKTPPKKVRPLRRRGGCRYPRLC
jgi:hypothetical protein